MEPLRSHATRRQHRGQLGRPAVAPATASDAQLLDAIAGGSEPAFEELRRRYQRAVERACQPIVGADVEDCVQEVFVRIWRKAALYDCNRGGGAAWLLTLARHTALNIRQASRPDAFGDLIEPPQESHRMRSTASGSTPRSRGCPTVSAA